MQLDYQCGFGNHFQSEAIPNTLHAKQNSPQKVAHQLYAEQLSGSAFTMPRNHNLRSWQYRIRPSVLHGKFREIINEEFGSPSPEWGSTPPTQMRWDPLPYPQQSKNFIESLITLVGNANVEMHSGAAIHLYAATKSMEHCYFYNADGEFLIVLQEGSLEFKTEFGILGAKPGEIVVIPRGVKFQVKLVDTKARGYICENYGLPFRLPDLGIIGSNGLANPRDFKVPVAYFEELEGNYVLMCKFQGKLWEAKITHSPLDVVAWHGNYVPYKYDLLNFNTINSVSFDHPDPSIFTVLTSPSPIQGLANVDFVIFPPRWMVANETFRPPYFHRNIMNEYMGLIYGKYDAKETGFVPGGSSLHNCMSAHGPDAVAFHKAVNAELKPEYYNDILAFMFESHQVWRLSPYAKTSELQQENYLNCWSGLKKNFKKID